jgi:hypothetical protein
MKVGREMKKITIVGSIVLLFVINNLFWVFGAFDESVTIDHLTQESIYKEKDVNLLKKLAMDLSVATLEKEKVEMIVMEKYSEHLIKRQDNILFIDGVGLKFGRSVGSCPTWLPFTGSN